MARDTAFKQVVYRDSASVYAMNRLLTDRNVFQPQLEENTAYYLRTRLQWAPGLYSGWKSSTLKTALHDRRFEYLGVVSQNLATSGDTNLKNKFLVAGRTLYVFDINRGYYASKDGKTWKSYLYTTASGLLTNDL